jgi:hypothetical protein
MNRKASNKTTMDWLLGIHALLVKGLSEQAEASTVDQGNLSELSQPVGHESTQTLAWPMGHGDSAEHPLFNPDAARFVRGVHAGLRVSGASVEPASHFEEPSDSEEGWRAGRLERG